MEEIILFIVLVLGAIILMLIGGVLGVVALVKTRALRQEVWLLRREVEGLRMREQVRMGAAPERPAEAAGPATPEVRAAEAPGAVPPVVVPPRAAVANPREAPVAPPPRVPPAAAREAQSRVFGGGAAAREAAEAGMRSLESRIGQRWIAWVGAVVVFLSGVFFLKYAFDNDWVGPTGQVAISALVGLCMLGAGSYYEGKRWRILGQALMGLGLGILYATFFAAFAWYEPRVMGQTAAFGFMVGVTAVGMALAVRHDALTTAFLAVLGGILTPVLVSTGHDARDALFTYLFLLDLGVVAVAFFKRWRLLDALAMVGSFILYMGWYGQFYKSEGLGLALTWLGAFYGVFLVLPFVYHLVRQHAVTLERFLMALANALFGAAYAWYTLHPDHLHAMAFVALGMAACYMVIGALLRRRLPGDARALFGLIALAVTFLTLAVPLRLNAEGILLTWVAEAPVLAFLAYRFRYAPVRVFAAAILVLGMGRLFFWHWPLHHGLYVAFFNRHFLSALAVPAAAAAYAGIHQLFADEGTVLDRGLKIAAALGGGFLALVVVHAELWGGLHDSYGAAVADSAVAALWALGAVLYLAAGTKAVRAAPWVWGVGTLALVVAGVRALIMYGDDLSTAHVLFGNARFAAGLLLTAAAFGYAWVIGPSGKNSQSPQATMGMAFLVGSIAGLLSLLSTEVYTFCVDAITDYPTGRRAGQMSITLVWSLYAAVLLSLGFWRRWRPLRLGGLALFGVAAVKLVLVDLAFLNSLYRIVAFLVLGVLMLAASYLYHRLEQQLAGAPAEGEAVGNGARATGDKS